MIHKGCSETILTFGATLLFHHDHLDLLREHLQYDSTTSRMRWLVERIHLSGGMNGHLAS
jgi:hypothetical protein